MRATQVQIAHCKRLQLTSADVDPVYIWSQSPSPMYHGGVPWNEGLGNREPLGICVQMCPVTQFILLMFVLMTRLNPE